MKVVNEKEKDWLLKWAENSTFKILNFKRITFFLLYFISFFVSKAQTDSSSKLIFGLDSRNSFIRGQKAKFQGIKLGIKKEHLSYGFAVYFLSPAIKKEGTFEGIGKHKIDGTVEMYFSYASGWAEYAWVENKYWELATAWYLGIGNLEILYHPYDLSIIPKEQRVLGVNEFFGTLIYKPHKYFGIGVGAGFRSMLTYKKIISESFDSPLYQFRIKLFTTEIYQDAKKWYYKIFKRSKEKKCLTNHNEVFNKS